jgi:hypothetical protein
VNASANGHCQGCDGSLRLIAGNSQRGRYLAGYIQTKRAMITTALSTAAEMASSDSSPPAHGKRRWTSRVVPRHRQAASTGHRMRLERMTAFHRGCVKNADALSADGWPAGNFRFSDFDGRAEKHELLRRGLRPAWPPSGAGHPRWRSHASDCRPERGGSSLFGPFRGFWS